MCEKDYHVLPYGMTTRERPQYYSDNHTAIQQSTSSCQDPYPLSPSSYVSSYLSESSYTGYDSTNGYDIESNSDKQSNSCCASHARSHHGGIDPPCNTSMFASGTYGDQGTEKHSQKTANLPSHFDNPFPRHDTQDYNPYDDISLDEYLLNQFSTNAFSSIGSQFQFEGTLDLEENPIMDPVLSQDLPTTSDYNANVTAASQVNPDDRTLSYDPNFHADGWVPPAASTAWAYANSAHCEASIAFMPMGAAVMPIDATYSIASTLDYLSTDSTTPSNYSPNTASVETGHSSGSSNLGNPCYSAASRATATRTSPHLLIASPGYFRNGTSSDVVPVAAASSSCLETSHHRCQKTSRRLAPTKVLRPRQPRVMDHSGYDKCSDTTAYAKSSSSLSTFHHPIQKTSRRLAPTKTLKPKQPRAMDHSGYDKQLETTANDKSSHSPPASVTDPNSKNNVSRCPVKGCSAIRSGITRKVNLRTHVRDVHEKPAPPTCEICEVVYVKAHSLKRHIEASHQHIKLPDGARIVRMRRADGTVYATYPEVHDYVDWRNSKKA